MPYIASIGTYLSRWGAPRPGVVGGDEDAITLAVEAGRAALFASGVVERLGLVSRGLPVNPSGGLKAKGHLPVGGERISLGLNTGGSTAISAVAILEGSVNGAR